MIQFNRRSVLASLAGGAAASSMIHAIPKSALAATTSDVPECHNYLYLVQQNGTHEPFAVDFWSRPRAMVRYETYLPPQIARALIAYEDFPQPIDSADGFLDASGCSGDWLDSQRLDRFAAAPAVGSENFQSVLMSFVRGRNAPDRTAMLAMDSTGLGPGWSQISAAFPACYKSTIGIYYIGARGFVQEKSHYKTADDFVRDWLSFTSSCDAVIVISSGLLELDSGLSAQASSEDLAGELIRRLSYALTNPKVLQRIVGPSGAKSRPRYFALSSVTLKGPFSPFSPFPHIQLMLDHQSTFIAEAFAPLAVNELPLFVATAMGDDPEYRSVAMANTIAGTILTGNYLIASDDSSFATVQAPPYQPDLQRSDVLDLIALWPFNV